MTLIETLLKRLNIDPNRFSLSSRKRSGEVRHIDSQLGLPGLCSSENHWKVRTITCPAEGVQER
jgi:hypothetical protein